SFGEVAVTVHGSPVCHGTSRRNSMPRARSLMVTSAILLATACSSAPKPAALATRSEPAPSRIGIVPKRGPYAPGFDALHYAISISLPDSGKVIRATTRVDLLLKDPMQDTLNLDFSGLRVDQITTQLKDKKPKVVQFRQDSARLHI